jgi:aspartate aminotransferase
MLVLNSPSNPSGAVYSRAQLEAIVAVAVKHNLYILSDEMYEHLMYDGTKPTCIATLSKEAEARTIVVAGFSKTYSMTGWRVGYAACSRPLAQLLGTLQEPMISCISGVSQYAALAGFQQVGLPRVYLEVTAQSTTVTGSTLVTAPTCHDRKVTTATTKAAK